MTVKDFFLKLHFHNEREQIQFEAHANLVRLQTVSLINIQLEAKNKIRKPEQLWQFPWEEEERAPSQERTEQKAGIFENAERLSKLL